MDHFQQDMRALDAIASRMTWRVQILVLYFARSTNIWEISYDPSYGTVGLPGFTEFAPADINVSPYDDFKGLGDRDYNNDGVQEEPGQARSGSESSFTSFNLILYDNF